MTRLLAAVVALVLAWPASIATAHVLSIRSAELKARSEAYFIAGRLDDRPRISVRSSRRVSRHVVDVRVRFRFRDEAATCRVLTIRVRFASSVTRRLSVGFPVPPARC